ncbi:beta-glucoside-specific PTS transporter subunit IIABC [Priestia megaterium]|uniref:beta-glucoside-specific PTS transporter subunit IIABC n=1 Tax=Priestia megaterium TaxID=1404 RepID=UPI002E1BD93F|nr:beta-glucoside-specific PTS transporter subunit IIABC [Priestia megaterium]MED4116280.1 beta-glucoside-specific PTS transporter subunit IIABC [Priestia megaterium]
MDHNQTAKKILRHVGGEENIIDVVHCATRLRFKLVENQKANKPQLEEMSEVLSVVESGGQYQVVIGNEVSHVHAELTKMTNVDSKNEKKAVNSNETLLSKVFEVISASFSPLIPALVGAGMIKAFLALAVLLGWISVDSSTYLILTAVGNAIFYFLPIFLGITLASKLGANPYIGGVIGAALLEPNFTGMLANGTKATFAGIPVVLIDYSASVFPIFIAVSIFALLEKGLKKVIYKDVQLFLVPTLSLVIIVPFTVLVFGPFGVYVGEAIGSSINFLNETSSIITGVIVGASFTFLTILGLHWGVLPIILQDLSDGASPILAMSHMATFAQIGLAIGIFLKTRDKKIKAVSGPAALTGLLAGVTEPIIYGLMLRYKRTIPYIVIAGAVGGGILGSFNGYVSSFVFPSVFSLGAYQPIFATIISISSAIIIGLLLPIFLGYEDKEKKMERETAEAGGEPIQKGEILEYESVVSPLTGVIQPLSQVDDPVFSSEAMGKGIAIQPSEGVVVAPFDGTVTSLFPTGHAVGVTSLAGAEVLIHIGINTVELKGKHFKPLVSQGDTVKKGDKLIEFDIEGIKEAGYSIMTPVIVTNTFNYQKITNAVSGNIHITENLLQLRA